MDTRAHTKGTVFDWLEPDKREHLKPHPVCSRTIAYHKKTSLHQSRYPFVGLKIEIANNYMDTRAHTKGTVFDRLEPDKREHLKPHPVCSQTISCHQKASLRQSHNPFVGLNIEIANDCKKKELDASSHDEGYDTPAKKPFSPVALSPDLGCFVDCCSPPAGQGSLSTFAISKPALLPVVSWPLLDSANSPVEPFEGDVEDVLKIGPPILESSVCHIDMILDGGSEQGGQVLEEEQGHLTEPIHECQTTLDRQESTLDTSYVTMSPPQVQVKSAVVVPAWRRDRPVVLDMEEELEWKKQMYLHSVSRHMVEKQGESQAVMDEVQDLMTYVADQAPHSHGRQWQHPSDLTRRNYQRRFGNMVPTMTLHEWQAKNWATFKRFGRVPKPFQRS